MSSQYIKGRQPSINELMGSSGEQRKSYKLSDLGEILGEKMPEIPMDRVGKIRLVTALHQRFGPDFMNLPGIKGLVDDFDKELAVNTVIKANRST